MLVWSSSLGRMKLRIKIVTQILRSVLWLNLHNLSYVILQTYDYTSASTFVLQNFLFCFLQLLIHLTKMFILLPPGLSWQQVTFTICLQPKGSLDFLYSLSRKFFICKREVRAGQPFFFFFKANELVDNVTLELWEEILTWYLRGTFIFFRYPFICVSQTAFPMYVQMK